MFEHPSAKISTPMIQAIEDAVLLGHIRELSGVLDLISDEAEFPENLHYAIEALLYFRIYYGKGGMLEPANDGARQSVIQMESLWGREIIEMIGHAPDMTEAKYA
jgi:hypothetical protein